MALLIAALAAEGTSTIANVGQIDRGYEKHRRQAARLGRALERVKRSSERWGERVRRCDHAQRR